MKTLPILFFLCQFSIITVFSQVQVKSESDYEKQLNKIAVQVGELNKKDKKPTFFLQSIHIFNGDTVMIMDTSTYIFREGIYYCRLASSHPYNFIVYLDKRQKFTLIDKGSYNKTIRKICQVCSGLQNEKEKYKCTYKVSKFIFERPAAYR